jgi:hypothetical protein
MIRRLTGAAAAAALLVSIAASAVAAGGPPSLAFYVDGVRYRTVGTPTDFGGTGAPAHSYDRIYVLGDGLVNVAEAKPGDRDYNGGRWMVLRDLVPPARRQLTANRSTPTRCRHARHRLVPGEDVQVPSDRLRG